MRTRNNFKNETGNTVSLSFSCKDVLEEKIPKASDKTIECGGCSLIKISMNPHHEYKGILRIPSKVAYWTLKLQADTSTIQVYDHKGILKGKFVKNGTNP